MTLFKRHITPFQLAVAGISFLALLIFLQVMLFTAQKRQAEAADAWVVHTFSVIDKIEDVFSKVKDIELGQRGYVLTGQTRFLDPYKAALGLSMEESAYADMGYLDNHSLLETLQEINELTKDNAPQQANLKQLEIGRAHV